MIGVEGGRIFGVERGPGGWLFLRVGPAPVPPRPEPPLGEQVWSLLAQHFTYRVVLECQLLAQLTAEQADELAQLKRRIEDHDGILRLCGLSNTCLASIEQCGLGQQLSHYASRGEAVMANRPRQPR